MKAGTTGPLSLQAPAKTTPSADCGCTDATPRASEGVVGRGGGCRDPDCTRPRLHGGQGSTHNCTSTPPALGWLTSSCPTFSGFQM